MLSPPYIVGINAATIPFLLTAFQGLLLAAALWFKPMSKVSNQYLANRCFAVLMLVFSVILLEHVADLAGFFFVKPDFIGIAWILYFLVGPLMYTYTKLQTSPNMINFKRHYAWHVLPILIYVAILLPYLLSDRYDAKAFWFYFELFSQDYANESKASVDCPLSAVVPWQWQHCSLSLIATPSNPELTLTLHSPFALLWFMNIDVMMLWVSLLGYSSASIVTVLRHRKSLQQIASHTQSRDLSWLLSFLVFLGAVTIIYVSLSALEMFYINAWISDDTRNYIVYLLIGCSIIYIGMRALLQPEIFSESLLEASDALNSHNEVFDVMQAPLINPSQLEVVQSDTSLVKCNIDKSVTDITNNKYSHSALTEELALMLAEQVKSHMEHHKTYLKADLSLPELAVELDISVHALSQTLNDAIGMNFFTFINSYRLNEVKKCLLSDSQSSILDIALASGFSSKSSFYSFFKKQLGISPSQWRKSMS